VSSIGRLVVPVLVMAVAGCGVPEPVREQSAEFNISSRGFEAHAMFANDVLAMGAIAAICTSHPTVGRPMCVGREAEKANGLANQLPGVHGMGRFVCGIAERRLLCADVTARDISLSLVASEVQASELSVNDEMACALSLAGELTCYDLDENSEVTFARTSMVESFALTSHGACAVRVGGVVECIGRIDEHDFVAWTPQFVHGVEKVVSGREFVCGAGRSGVQCFGRLERSPHCANGPCLLRSNDDSVCALDRTGHLDCVGQDLFGIFWSANSVGVQLRSIRDVFMARDIMCVLNQGRRIKCNDVIVGAQASWLLGRPAPP